MRENYRVYFDGSIKKNVIEKGLLSLGYFRQNPGEFRRKIFVDGRKFYFHAYLKFDDKRSVWILRVHIDWRRKRDVKVLPFDRRNERRVKKMLPQRVIDALRKKWREERRKIESQIDLLQKLQNQVYC